MNMSRCCFSIIMLMTSVVSFGVNERIPQEYLSVSSVQAKDVSLENEASSNRRRLGQYLYTVCLMPPFFAAVPPAIAEIETETIEMKSFVDPVGLFQVDVPKGFFTLRRSAKGDLPDEKTGKGRRGSSIFTAGNMAKAEVVAVKRFPARVLLEENGVDASGSLITFPDMGEPAAIASLVNMRRERDQPGSGSTKLDPTSVTLSADGKEINFTLRTNIDVQKPELLMEQYGVTELVRITLAKVSLRSNDGNILAVFASCLETDFTGPDGDLLRQTVSSFVATDRSNANI